MCNSRTIKPWKLCFSEFNNTIQFYLTLGLFWIIFFFYGSILAISEQFKKKWPHYQRNALIRCLNSKGQNRVRVFLTILEKITADIINFVEAGTWSSNSACLWKDPIVTCYLGIKILKYSVVWVWPYHRCKGSTFKEFLK